MRLSDLDNPDRSRFGAWHVFPNRLFYELIIILICLRLLVSNWLLAWLKERDIDLIESGPLPKLLPSPSDPVTGHPGDPVVE